MEKTNIEANEQYQRAYRLACVDGVGIKARVTNKRTGALLGFVVKGKGAGEYRVTLEGNTLKCNCPAGRKAQYCKHRAFCTHHEIERKAAESAAKGYDCDRPYGETTPQFYQRIAGVNPIDLTEHDFSIWMACEYLAGGDRREAINLWKEQMRAYDPQITLEMEASDHHYGDFSPYLRAMKRSAKKVADRDAMTATQGDQAVHTMR